MAIKPSVSWDLQQAAHFSTHCVRNTMLRNILACFMIKGLWPDLWNIKVQRPSGIQKITKM